MDNVIPRSVVREHKKMLLSLAKDAAAIDMRRRQALRQARRKAWVWRMLGKVGVKRVSKYELMRII